MSGHVPEVSMSEVSCVRCRKRKKGCDKRLPMCGSCSDIPNQCYYPSKSANNSGSASPARKMMKEEGAPQMMFMAAPAPAPATQGSTSNGHVPAQVTPETESHIQIAQPVPQQPGDSHERPSVTQEPQQTHPLASPSPQHLLKKQPHQQSLIQQPQPLHQTPQYQQQQPQQQQHLVHHVPRPQRSIELPPDQVAITLVEAYFSHTQCMYPFLPRGPFIRSIKSLYESPVTPPPRDIYRFFMVLAIGSATLEWAKVMNKTDAQIYYMRAQQKCEKVMRGQDLGTVEALLLESLYSFFNPRGQTLWNLSGLAARTAAEMGLHRPASSRLSPEEKELRKGLFWSIYSLDRIVSVSLGRPLLFRDEDVSVELPSLYSAPLVPNDPTTIPLENENRTILRHLVHLRRLQGDILHQLYLITTPTSNSEEREKTVLSLHAACQQWRQATPQLPAESSVLLTILHIVSYYDLQYHYSLIRIYSPNVLFPNTSPAGISVLSMSSSEAIKIYATICSLRITFVWTSIREIYVTLLTFLYALHHNCELSTAPQQLLGCIERICGMLDDYSSRWQSTRRVSFSIMALARGYLAAYTSPDSVKIGPEVGADMKDLIVSIGTYTKGETQKDGGGRAIDVNVQVIGGWYDEFIKAFG